MQVEVGVIKHNVSRKNYLASLKGLSVFEQKKTKEYTTVILTFLALIIFGVFAINPTLSTIIQLRKQLADSTFVDNQLSEKINNLQLLQKQYDDLKPDLPVVAAALPASPDAPTLIGQIQSLVKKHNLSLDEVQMGAVPYDKSGIPPGQSSSYVVAFSVSGTYDDLNQFIADAINFDRLITIDQAALARDQQQPTGLKGTVDIRAYFDQQPL